MQPGGPRLAPHLDPALGVSAAEFHGATDEAPRRPSEAQLRAYRLAQRIGRELDASGRLKR